MRRREANKVINCGIYHFDLSRRRCAKLRITWPSLAVISRLQMLWDQRSMQSASGTRQGLKQSEAHFAKIISSVPVHYRQIIGHWSVTHPTRECKIMLNCSFLIFHGESCVGCDAKLLLWWSSGRSMTPACNFWTVAPKPRYLSSRSSTFWTRNFKGYKPIYWKWRCSFKKAWGQFDPKIWRGSRRLPYVPQEIFYPHSETYYILEIDLSLIIPTAILEVWFWSGSNAWIIQNCHANNRMILDGRLP